MHHSPISFFVPDVDGIAARMIDSGATLLLGPAELGQMRMRY